MSGDRILITPAERREAIVDLIDGARRRLVLAPGECDDRTVIDALAAAAQRGVRVDVLLSRRAKQPANLRLLRILLETLGAHVWRYDGPHRKYHAKFIVADRRHAIAGSMNFTRWCFKRSCDFAVRTSDPAVARGLDALFDADCSGQALPSGTLPERLVVAPEQARARIGDLIASARRSIRLIDPKVSDPRLLAMLDARAKAGVAITLLPQSVRHDRFAPHGKLLLIDDELALIGSMALSAGNLDRRREVGLLVTDRQLVSTLIPHFEGHTDEVHRRTRHHLDDNAAAAGVGPGHGLALHLG